MPNSYSFTVEQPDSFGSPVYKRNEQQDLYSRTVSLNQISTADVNQSLEGKKVWVVSHGWNSDYGAFGEDLAQKIIQARPQDVVFAIDWENAARTEIIDYSSLPEEFRNIGSNANDFLGIAFGSAAFYAATWIGVVADAVAEQLASLGAKNENINLVGHSLGTLLNNEIAHRLMITYGSQTGGSKVKSITALDPPSENFFGRPIIPTLESTAGFFSRFTNGYVYPRRVGVDPEVFQEVDPEYLRYTDLAEFSRAFLGKASIAGNANFASFANESILLDYSDGNALQHNWVHTTFQEIILEGKGLTHNLLNLEDYQSHSEFQQDYFAASGTFNKSFEGVVLADSSNLPYPVLGFYAKKTSGDGFVVYGRDTDDQVEVVQAGHGYGFVMNGKPLDRDLLSTANTYYLGAGNDYIKSSDGNDIIYGDFPEESHHAAISVENDRTHNRGKNLDALKTFVENSLVSPTTIP